MACRSDHQPERSQQESKTQDDAAEAIAWPRAPGPISISLSCSQSATDTHHLQAFKTSALVRTCVTRVLRVTATVARQENLHACTASDGDDDRPRSQRRRRGGSAGPARGDIIPAERRPG